MKEYPAELKPSKCPTFYTFMISGDKEYRKKSVNYVILKLQEIAKGSKLYTKIQFVNKIFYRYLLINYQNSKIPFCPSLT